MLELQEKIYNFIISLNYEIKSDYLHFDYNKDLEDFLLHKGVVFEKIREEEINIDFSNLGFIVFQNSSQFLTENNLQKKEDILIIDFEGTSLSRIEKKSYLNFKLKDDFYFIFNAEKYIEFISFLKSKDEESEDAFHFIDYSNSVSRKIVLTSLTEKSRLILQYFKEVPVFSDDRDFSLGLSEFKNCFSNDNNLPKFLKSSLIKYALRYESKQRTKLVFENLQAIVYDAKMNFEIYINNLSIDKIRKDYDSYKSKYFIEVSDVLKKLTQQIIGFPIVVSATLFAVEKVKGNDAFLWILIAVILVTTIYLTLLLNMNYKDLDYIKHLSEKDYAVIKDNNFFVKFPEEFKTFQKIKHRISSRIKNLIIICESYFWILSLSNTAIICLLLNYLEYEPVVLIMYSLMTLFIMVIAHVKTSTEVID